MADGPATEQVGVVFDIKRFAVHDGPGIRTTVFLKGCPLACPWCHNPEAQQQAPEIAFLPDSCIGCHACADVCPEGCHRLTTDGRHVYDRGRCRRCGACALVCHAEALELVGRSMGVAEVLDEVLKDQPFYETSGGGVTISGGEPMHQYAFTAALLTAARARGLHTCLDTTGFAPYRRYAELLPMVNLFLYDLKETDPARHQRWTGVPLARVRENLAKLDADGAATVLRCPIIPGLNDRDEHFSALAAIANSLRNITGMTVHPYHPLGRAKRERMALADPMPELAAPEHAVVTAWIAAIQSMTDIPVGQA